MIGCMYIENTATHSVHGSCYFTITLFPFSLGEVAMGDKETVILLRILPRVSLLILREKREKSNTQGQENLISDCGWYRLDLIGILYLR